jgi:hypothetical protein
MVSEKIRAVGTQSVPTAHFLDGLDNPNRYLGF